jgi:phage tail-like protein
MRGTIVGLPSPRPFAAELPGLYHQPADSGDGAVPRVGRVRVRPLAERFLAALDEVLAPVFSTLDNVDAYLDPWLAPSDFVDFIAGWVAAPPDETWPLERRRELVAHALPLHALRGTAAGLARQVRAYTGIEPEIEESGGIAWSTTADSPLPGEPRPRVHVRLRVRDPAALDVRHVRALVEAVRPAHVLASVEILADEEAAA